MLGGLGEAPAAEGMEGLGAEPLAANGLLRFSHRKTLVPAHFLIEKGHTGRPTCSARSHYYSVRQCKNTSVVHV